MGCSVFIGVGWKFNLNGRLTQLKGKQELTQDHSLLDAGGLAVAVTIMLYGTNSKLWL